VKFRVAALLLVLAARTEAVILFRTGDPAANTTAPTGELANSGWQYEGLWGGFLGTPIAPHYFISAAHIGHQGDFVFNGATYHVVRQFFDPETDLQILQVAETLPSFAPLYTGRNEIGGHIVAIGRGTQRGSELVVGDALKGWAWGAGDGVMRWGENIVSRIFAFGSNNDLLMADFDAAGLPDECHLSVGDSGGAAFIDDGGTWKLAGIHYAVDGPFYTNADGSGSFFAALFDARGFYENTNHGIAPITGTNPVPTALYPTRISKRLAWVASVIAAPVLTREENFVAFTYTRLIAPPADLSYMLEQSSDLDSWSPASIDQETVTSNASVETVKALVDSNAVTPLFLRLRITRP
jgi:hypothetical protein